MPDRTARVLGALAAGLLAVLLAGPVALAQTEEVPSEDIEPEEPPADPDAPQEPEQPEQPEEHPPGSWEGSSYEAPFDQPDPTLSRSTFDVAGTLRYQKTGPADFIQHVEVRVVDDPTDSFSPGDGCSLPEPVAFRGEGAEPGLVAEQPFLVEDVTLPCNGRYVVEAEGRLEDPEAAPYTLQRSFVLSALPASVTGLGVTLDGDDRAVTATFQPLAEEELAVDAIGYVLERSGPDDDDTFVDVASIGLDDEPAFVDPLSGAPAGAYTYRVRAVRGGADGDVRSSVVDTETDTVEVEGDPATTPASRRGAIGSRSSGGRATLPRRGAAPRSTTPTTLDTGFEDTLDYGEQGGGAGSVDDELAGDEPVAGQSIVRDEGEEMGLAVPAAGALVMLGWAGHILYLNRLAKQL